jgi:hypothetical protein
MKFEVYCDESRPDLLGSRNPEANFMVIGSLWLEAERRTEFKRALHEMRNRHHIGGEFKWQKISPSRLNFYLELVDWFIAQGENLRFRCIAVDRRQVNLVQFHESDQELGFYKFYYQMLLHWISDFNEYSIFCDFKKNRIGTRLEVLQRCLSRSNLSSSVPRVQALPSEELVLVQLADVFTGMVSAKLNETLAEGGAKSQVVRQMEAHLCRKIRHTPRGEKKFNVFVIDLQGGW